MSYQSNHEWRQDRATRLDRENRIDRICNFIEEIQTEGTRLNNLFSTFPEDRFLKFDYAQIQHALKHLIALCNGDRTNLTQKDRALRALRAIVDDNDILYHKK